MPQTEKRVAEIQIRISEAFKKNLAKLKTQVSSFGEKARAAGKKAGSAFADFAKNLGPIGSLLAGLSVGVLIKEFTDLVFSVASAQDQMIKAARVAGVTSEELSGLAFSADLGGASVAAFQNGLRKLSKSMNDAENTTGPAARALADLGISASDADGNLKTTFDLTLEISDAFAGMENGAKKAAIAQDLFGKSGTDLINTLNAGSDALREQQEEARSLGIIVGTEAGENSEKFNDAWLRVTSVFKGVGNALSNALIPTFTEFFGFIRAQFGDIRNLQKEFAGVDVMLKGVLQTLKILFAVVRTVWNGFQTFGEILGALIGGVMQAFIGVTYEIGDSFRTLGEIILNTGKVISSALKFDFSGAKEAFGDVQKAFKDFAKEGGEVFNEVKAAASNFGSEVLEITERNSQDMADAWTSVFSQPVEQAAQGGAEAAGRAIAAVSKKEIEEAKKRAQEMANLREQVRSELIASELAFINTQLGLERGNFDKQLELRAEQYEILKAQIESQEAERLEKVRGNTDLEAQVRETFFLKMQDLEAKNLEYSRKIAAQRQKMILGETKGFLQNLQTATEGSKKFAILNKGFAIARASISGYESAVHNFRVGSQIGGPIVGGAFAAASLAATGKIIADIATQKFANGGFPVGRNALATLNDDPQGGQEAVLNAGAVKSLGFNAINRLNAGESPAAVTNNANSVNINVAGVQVGEGADRQMIESAVQTAVENSVPSILRAIREGNENGASNL